MIINTKLFAKRLKEAREEKQLTVRELAEMVSTSGATISRYETGTHEPKSIMIVKLSLALRVSSSWLMGANVSKYGELGSAPCKKNSNFRHNSGRASRSLSRTH
jgi:transcriptional regulator with XRE-family HTH domain